MVLRCHFGSSYSCLSFPPTLFQCFDPPKRRRETDSECLHHTVGIALLVQHTLCDPLAPTVKNIPDGWEGGMTKNGSLCIVLGNQCYQRAVHTFLWPTPNSPSPKKFDQSLTFAQKSKRYLSRSLPLRP